VEATLEDDLMRISREISDDWVMIEEDEFGEFKKDEEGLEEEEERRLSGVPVAAIRWAVSSTTNPFSDDDSQVYFFVEEEDAQACAETVVKEQGGHLAILRFGDDGEWYLDNLQAHIAGEGEQNSADLLDSFQGTQWMKVLPERVSEKHKEILQAPATVEGFPRLRFDQLERGDVILQNTCGPPPIAGWLMGWDSPAGQMGMTHAALVMEPRYQGMPDRAIVWEMFEQGASLRPLQGSARDEHDKVTDTSMLVVRYQGPDRERLLERLGEIVKLWHQHRHNFGFPKFWRLLVPTMMLPGRAKAPDLNAKSYAQKARDGVVPSLEDESGDASQYCSSLVIASWQAALGSLVDLEHEDEMLQRLPMRAQRSKPTDWSLLPNWSPFWDISGVVTNFSAKRRFEWYGNF